MSCIGVHIDRLGNIGIGASRIDSMLVDVSVICDIDTGRYLIVTPTYLWVTDWDKEMVDVKSNTNWNVE